MNALNAILREPVLEQLGWMLVHSVWQCTAIAVVLAVVLCMLRRSETRYLAGCAALLGCIAAGAVTFLIREPAPMPTVAIAPATPIATELSLTIPAAVGTQISAPPASQSMQFPLSLAAAIWLAGVVMLCARQVMGWMSLRRLRHGSLPIIDGQVLNRLRSLMQRMNLSRTVNLVESAQVQVPSMIGWLRPMILLPIGALNSLSPLHLDAILAHELAHIRRSDYLVNLIQTLVETLLFYHPAVWWISKTIRQEREHCCDDMAVRIVGDARQYGEALAAMEELRTPGEFAMAASGGSLLKRIKRLAKSEPRRSSAFWPIMLVVGVIVLIGACTQTTKTQAQTDASGNLDPCAMHLRQIAVAAKNYGQDNRGRYPADLGGLIAVETRSGWLELRYIPTLAVLLCPATGHGVPDNIAHGTPAEQAIWARTGSDYVYVGKGLITQVEMIAKDTPIVVAYESGEHHGTGKGVHVAFADGRVALLSTQAVQEAIRKSDQYRDELRAQAVARQAAEQPATQPNFNPADYINATAAEMERLTPEQRRAVVAELQRQQQRQPATTQAQSAAPAIDASSPFADLAQDIRLESTPQERIRIPNAAQPYDAKNISDGNFRGAGQLQTGTVTLGGGNVVNGGTLLLSGQMNRLDQSATQRLLATRLIGLQIATIEKRASYGPDHQEVRRAEQIEETVRKNLDESMQNASLDVRLSVAQAQLTELSLHYTDAQIKRIETENTFNRNHPTVVRLRAQEEQIQVLYAERLRQVMSLNLESAKKMAAEAKP